MWQIVAETNINNLCRCTFLYVLFTGKIKGDSNRAKNPILGERTYRVFSAEFFYVSRVY